MVLFSETSDFLRCFANSIGVMYFHLWIFFFDIYIYIYIHIAPVIIINCTSRHVQKYSTCQKMWQACKWNICWTLKVYALSDLVFYF